MPKKHNTVLLERKIDARTSNVVRYRSLTGLMPWKMYRLPDRLQTVAENELFECIVIHRLVEVDHGLQRSLAGGANPSATKIPTTALCDQKSATRICTAGEAPLQAMVDLDEPVDHYALKQLVLCGCLESRGQPVHFPRH